MLSKEYKLVPSFALKFQCNKKALKIIPLCYADSKNGIMENMRKNIYDIILKRKKEKIIHT